MKKLLLTLIILAFSTKITALELPVFDKPVTAEPSPASIFSPGGDLEDIDEQISVSMSVPNPQPNQSFKVSVESFSSDLNKANIYWYKNNDLISSGVGVKSQNFVAPGMGKVLSIGLRIETSAGNIITKEYEIAPALVNLTYETQTYTPPFYKGKAIFTHQSQAMIYALPSFIEDGIIKNPKELVYTWEINGSVQQSSSGYGRDTFLYQGSIIPQPVLITVTVESDTSNQVALNDIVLEPAETEVLLVQEHPLYGMIYNQNNEIRSDLNSVIIHAIPLFSSVSTRENSVLDYIWSLNGVELGEDNNSSIISFQSTEDREGTASLFVRLENKQNILQSTNGSTSVIMNKTKSLIQGTTEDFSL